MVNMLLLFWSIFIIINIEQQSNDISKSFDWLIKYKQNTNLLNSISIRMRFTVDWQHDSIFS